MNVTHRSFSRSSAGTSLAVICWAVLFGPSLAAHIANAANPLLFNDDVRQQTWPFFRYFEGGFTRDYVGGYYLNAFLPAGYWLVFSSLARFVDPVVTSKVAPYLLFAVTMAACTLTARRLQGTASLFGCGLLCLSSGLLLARMMGALPRGFGFPIVAVAMYALATGSVWWMAAAIIAGGLFYPAAAVAPGLALALWLLALPSKDRGQAATWSLVRRLSFLAAVATVAGLLVLPSVLSTQRYGRLLTPADERAYPETSGGGRYAPEDRAVKEELRPTVAKSVASTLVGYGAPFVPAYSLRGGPYEVRVVWGLAQIAVLGFALLCARSDAARRLLCLVVTACVSFIVAKQFAPYFYLPHRHVFYAVPLFIVVLLPPAAAAFADVLLARTRRYAAPALALLISIAAVLTLGGRVMSKTGLYIQVPPKQRLYRFLATLPPSALIAGFPDNLLDNVPYLSRRQVLLTYETHQAFHARYVEEMRRRMRAVIAAIYATDVAPIVQLRDKFHVTHLVVNRARFGPTPPVYFYPFSPELRRAYLACQQHACLLAKGTPRGQIFREGEVIVLDLSPLPAAPAGGSPEP